MECRSSVSDQTTETMLACSADHQLWVIGSKDSFGASCSTASELLPAPPEAFQYWVYTHMLHSWLQMRCEGETPFPALWPAVCENQVVAALKRHVACLFSAHLTSICRWFHGRHGDMAGLVSCGIPRTLITMWLSSCHGDMKWGTGDCYVACPRPLIRCLPRCHGDVLYDVRGRWLLHGIPHSHAFSCTSSFDCLLQNWAWVWG